LGRSHAGAWLFRSVARPTCARCFSTGTLTRPRERDSPLILSQRHRWLRWGQHSENIRAVGPGRGRIERAQGSLRDRQCERKERRWRNRRDLLRGWRQRPVVWSRSAVPPAGVAIGGPVRPEEQSGPGAARARAGAFLWLRHHNLAEALSGTDPALRDGIERQAREHPERCGRECWRPCVRSALIRRQRVDEIARPLLRRRLRLLQSGVWCGQVRRNRWRNSWLFGELLTNERKQGCGLQRGSSCAATQDAWINQIEIRSSGLVAQ